MSFEVRNRIRSVDGVAFEVFAIAHDIETMRDVYVLREIKKLAHWGRMGWNPDSYTDRTITMSKAAVDATFTRIESEILF